MGGAAAVGEPAPEDATDEKTPAYQPQWDPARRPTSSGTPGSSRGCSTTRPPGSGIRSADRGGQSQDSGTVDRTRIDPPAAARTRGGEDGHLGLAQQLAGERQVGDEERDGEADARRCRPRRSGDASATPVGQARRSAGARRAPRRHDPERLADHQAEDDTPGHGPGRPRPRARRRRARRRRWPARTAGRRGSWTTGAGGPRGRLSTCRPPTGPVGVSRPSTTPGDRGVDAGLEGADPEEHAGQHVPGRVRPRRRRMATIDHDDGHRAESQPPRSSPRCRRGRSRRSPRCRRRWPASAGRA